MTTCSTCKHWSPPLQKMTKKNPHPKGQCQRINSYGNGLAETAGGGCCNWDGPCYCDSPRLETSAEFGCNLWEVR